MILLLSDLHLPNEPSPLREGFLRFLAGPARAAREVYLLGDLFEYWVGDDVGLQQYAAEVAALRKLGDSGVRVFFIAGNRDFLLGSTFFKTSGVSPLPDPSVIMLGSVPTLISHGDLYCTDDRAYQRWRRFSRSALWQRAFALLPRRRRIAIAGGLRRQSHDAKHDKPAAIMDVNPAAVAAAFGVHAVTRLIHGHTHRPMRHTLQIAGRELERIVLPDWHGTRMEYLQIGDDNSCEIRAL